MSVSAVPLVVSLVLTSKIRKHVKVNGPANWEKPFYYAMFFSVFLFLAEAILQDSEIIKWIWHIYLIGLLTFSWKQKELQTLKGLMLAFLPFVIISFLNDVSEGIAPGFFKTYEEYFKSATLLSFIWMVAILYSQNRQLKAAEKERIIRLHEDELNRAIAIRKVELEVLVTERTAELTKQKEELENAIQELQSTQSQLIQAEKMASLGELTAGIAHEIQNPLNFVNNFSEVSSELIDEMKDELAAGNWQLAAEIANDVKQNLEKISHHGKRADAIVKGMLQHSRKSNGIKEPTNINTLADEFFRLAYHGLRAKDKSFNATLKTDFDDGIGNIDVIGQDIGRVILNLITNAFYAVSEKKNSLSKDYNGAAYEPTVTVTTSKTVTPSGKISQVMISVKDNGNGIPQAAMDKIFQPFFTTKPSGRGTGLGLSLSYEIVTKGHGGELRVDNKEGEGAEFTIILPVKN